MKVYEKIIVKGKRDALPLIGKKPAISKAAELKENSDIAEMNVLIIL